MSEPEFVIHVADILTDEGVQKCSRCGEILVDYRNAMTTSGSRFGGWEVDQFVSIGKHFGMTMSRAGRAPGGIDCNARPN